MPKRKRQLNPVSPGQRVRCPTLGYVGEITEVLEQPSEEAWARVRVLVLHVEDSAQDLPPVNKVMDTEIMRCCEVLDRSDDPNMQLLISRTSEEI